MKKLVPFLLLLILSTVVSCSWPTSYPNELTEADRMLMRGAYSNADSILARFDLSAAKENHQVGMYRQLLGLTRKYTVSALTAKDLPMADSLVRYYDKRGTRESAMAKLFLAEIYVSEGAYPSALNMLLLSEQDASVCESPTLQIWVNRMLGDVYFDQRMFGECTSFYRKSYSKACDDRDTFRMALGAFSMARVCMIDNDADSAIYYLNQAIIWSKSNQEGKKTGKVATSVLADIYIQTEQFDKAAAIIPHDSLNDYNWAYWHLDQHHTDSAYFYFSRLTKKDDWRGKVEYLPILAGLAEQKGNKDKALEYYKELSAAKDSLKAHSQIEETRQTKAQHHYNLIRQERDAAERHSRNMHYLLAGTIVAVTIVALMFWMAWRSYRTKKESELLQRKLLLKEEERKNKQSLRQIEANERHIADLEQSLQQAKAQNDEAAIERLQLEPRLLTVENENIKAKQSRDKLLVNELTQSPLYERIKENAGKEGFRLADDEWQTPATLLDWAYDQFTARLRMLYDGISENELHICYLVKLGVPSTDIGNMLCKSRSAVGMTRQRLYKKLTGSRGTARQMNDFIVDF